MTPKSELPKYQSHKKVWALKIKSISMDEWTSSDPNMKDNRGATIVPHEEGYLPFSVDAQFIHRHQPEEGGYYVVYEDGYKSYSPASAFESGYTPLNGIPIPKNVTFGGAIEALKEGKRAARAGWNGKRMFIYLNKGNYDFHSKDGVNVQIIEHIDGVPVQLFEGGAEGTATRLPNINMQAATGSTVTGWLASQTDLLAEDWQILD